MDSVPSYLTRLASGDWRRLQRAVAAFEGALHGGRRPAIDSYLDGPGEFDTALLVELVHAELEHRIRAGEPARVEEYAGRFPALPPAAVPDLVLTEYRARREREPLLDTAELLTRFPDHAETLRGLLESETGETVRRPAAAAGEPPLPVVPNYTVRRKLGQGGMGVVYEAWDERLGRAVALKMVRGDEDDGGADRFRREAEAAAQLLHPNVVPVFETGRAGGRTYLVMEYVPGGTLLQKLADAPLPPRAAAGLVAAVAGAVHAAHGRGVVHRDIKPANILLATDGTPKLADFGLAKRTDAAGLTRTGAVLGTPSYMAPEQVDGQAGPAADVYALGAVLYECLTGRPPFRGATTVETLDQVRHREPIPVRRLQPKIPRDLETVCLRCLQKEPAKRYATAAALAADLGRFLDGRPVVARPVGAAERGWKWARRRPVLTALGLLCVAAAGGLLAQWVRYTADLKTERDAADRARTDAQGHAAEAVKQAGLADARRQSAEASYRAARAALAEFKKLRADPRLGEGELEPFRRQMFAAEAGFYQQFAALNRDDEGFRAEQALALYDLGLIQKTLGDLPAALASADRAVALYERLGREKPDHEEYAYGQVSTRELRATLQEALGRTADADAEFAATKELAEQVAARWPGNYFHRYRLASLNHDLGTRARRRGDADRAVAFLRTAIELMDRMLKEPPEHAGEYTDRLRFTVSLAYAESARNRPADAAAVLRAGLAAADAAPPNVAAAPEVREMAATARGELGSLFVRTRKFREAEGPLTAAVRDLRELHRRFPARSHLGRQLAGQLLRLAEVDEGLNRPKEAGDRLTEAAAVAKAVYDRAPTHPQAASVYAEATAKNAWYTAPPADAAVPVLTDAIRTVEDLTKRFPAATDIATRLSDLYAERAGYHRDAERWADMEADAARAVPLVAGWRQGSPRMLRAYARAKLGRHAEAAAEVEELDRMPSRPDPFRTAHLFSVIAAAAAADPSLAGPERSAIADRYLDRAAQALKEADKLGRLKDPDRAAQLRTAPDFAALRQRAETKDLLARIAGSTAAR